MSGVPGWVFPALKGLLQVCGFELICPGLRPPHLLFLTKPPVLPFDLVSARTSGPLGVFSNAMVPVTRRSGAVKSPLELHHAFPEAPGRAPSM